MKSELSLNYVTRKDTTTSEFCRAFLGVLINRHPQLAPELYDTRPERECRKPFVSIEDALPTWAWRGVIQRIDKGVIEDESPFVGQNYLKRKSRVKYYATVNHTSTDRYADPILGRFNIYASIDKKTDWLAVFHDLAEVIEPVLGRMHIYLGAEAGGFPFNSPQMDFLAGPSRPEMRKGLTNLGWANVFAEEYAPEVDEARLREHGFAIEKVGAGKLFTVTDNLFDVADDFPKFSRRRAELKSLFRPGMFRIAEEPNYSTASPKTSILLHVPPGEVAVKPLVEVFSWGREPHGEYLFYGEVDSQAVKPDGTGDLTRATIFADVAVNFEKDTLAVARGDIGNYLQVDKKWTASLFETRINKNWGGLSPAGFCAFFKHSPEILIDVTSNSYQRVGLMPEFNDSVVFRYVRFDGDRVTEIHVGGQNDAVTIKWLWRKFRALCAEYSEIPVVRFG